MKDFNVVMGSPKVADFFGWVYGYPHTSIVDPQGRFVFTHAGIIDRTEVEAELAELLGEVKPSASSSSSFFSNALPIFNDIFVSCPCWHISYFDT
jgi:hypothetical protein